LHRVKFKTSSRRKEEEVDDAKTHFIFTLLVRVLLCIRVKLVDVPAMNYTSADKPCPRGEVCVKGDSVFVGYYQDKEKTAETIDADGWCHTGDIGMWDEKGRLRIIDRVKK
jgi:long-subunit acyl-CoA synthetase (AMP-forming)